MSENVSNFLAVTLSDYTVTRYHERDKLVNVDLRTLKTERAGPTKLAGLTIPTSNGPVPFDATGHVQNKLEYGVIWEHDCQPVITVQVDVHGNV